MSSQASRPVSGESRGAATRRQLIETGRSAFARKGLSGTNLKQDILDVAAVSVGSFYHHYKDKTDLLLAIMRHDSQAFRMKMTRLHSFEDGRTAESIARESYEMVFAVADGLANYFRIQMRERSSDDNRVSAYIRNERSLWIHDLERDYERMAIGASDEFDARLAAEMVFALSVGTIAHYLELPTEARPDAREPLIDGLVQFTVGGITAVRRSKPKPPLVSGE
jgi:AcrR family transcriptional regulator